ncbi:RNA-directed DNA polymerase, eukaryota, reverse transcriptase zinc-binding domain protein, partial [Tanacetum coccineum]
EEVDVFDEEMVKIGSKKWELTLCGQFVVHNMSLPMLNYHLRRMWARFGFKEIIDNRNGKWLFKFTREWDPCIGLDKIEPSVLPVWVKLQNMPMKAWTNVGISTIASYLGKPKIMDSMTSYVCRSGLGRTEYARVLVEIEAKKGLKEEIELQYRDKDQVVKGTKKIKVEYDWQPPVCSHCNVFGYNYNKCSKRTKSVKEIAREAEEKSKKVEEAEFNVVQNKIGKTIRNTETLDKQSSNKEKVVKSNNRYSVLEGINEDNQQDLNMLKDKMLVDKYLNLKVQPSSSEIKNWSQEMIKYFKRAWDADKEKEKNDALDGMEGIIEDVLEDESVAASGGCRIVIGWNPDVVKLLVINTSRQHMLCLIESIHNHKKIYFSFVYASNFGMERRGLWKELHMPKICTSGTPRVLMGDFNVTLNVSEHSAGKSTIDGDMEDFMDCVNNIEVEDVCSTGMHFTWIKSPKKPSTSVMKKLDRVMANDLFMDEYNQAYAVFHPFLTSDHSPHVMVIPLAMEKKKKSFKFANFVADKGNFLPVVEKGWNLETQGCHMFKLVKKLRMLKVSLNKLYWKDGNVFDNVVKLRDKLKAAQIEVNEGDRNSAYFHKVAMSRKSKNRILSIKSKAGTIVEGKKVVDEFVNHFEVFLGQSSPVKSIEEIGNKFTSKLTTEEASYMIREVTDNEIKAAMFDVCMAVKEFFSNGKFLKDVNATLIALIPKVNDACNVTDYRPIACYNVLYKCISKILTTRIKRGLDRVDITEKVDQKDVLLRLTLQKLMTLNHGYFKGGRGLRQGDPISPYLFTLVMEVFTLILNNKIQQSHDFKYHSGCKEIKLTHLCFADDLLVLCHGDVESVRVIKDALDEFSNVYSLKPNMSKSTILFRNVDIGDKNKILEFVLFQIGRFPMKYLGASVFLLPMSVVKYIERMLKGFLWTQGDMTRGKAKIAWKTICKPKMKGGLGYKDLGKWNEVLLTKHIWNIAAKKDTLWVQWIHMVKLRKKSIWEVTAETNDSWIWKCLLGLRDKAKKHIISKIGNGKDVSNAKLADMLENRLWKLRNEWNLKFPDICNIAIPILSDNSDKICIPSHMFIVWLAIQGRLQTQDRMVLWNNDYNMRCSLCSVCMDSHDHLFFNCSYSGKIWESLKLKIHETALPNDWTSRVNIMASRFHNRSIKSILCRIVFGAAVYFVWQERKRRQFTSEKKPVNNLLEVILETIRFRLANIKVIKSVFVDRVANE